MLLCFCLVWLTGCTGNSWRSAEDCAQLSAGAERDDCWSSHITEVFRKDPVQGQKIVEEQVQDPQIQDFIWLMITRDVDPTSHQYCQKIQDKALKERCRVLVIRPHLHREILKQREEGSNNKEGGLPASVPK